MNYKMPGMEIMIPELFAVFDTANVEIKKDHQVLMVGKTTSFTKGKGQEGKLHGWQASCCSGEETRG